MRCEREEDRVDIESPAAGVVACGARLRRGGTCTLAPSPGKRRCFQHGGARGIGAPAGNANAHRHGLFSAAEIAERRRINDVIRECNAFGRMVERSMKEAPDWGLYRRTRSLRP